MEKDNNPTMHALTQRFAKLWVKYTLDSSNKDLLLQCRKAQQELYTIQVHFLEGNTPKAKDLLPPTPWPYL